MPPLKYYLLLLLCLSVSQPAEAVEQFNFAAAEVRGEGWQARDLQLTTRLNQDSSLAVDVRSSQLKLLAGGQVVEQEFEDIHAQCSRLIQEDADYVCEQSQLSLGNSPVGATDLKLGWQFSDAQNWSVSLHQMTSNLGPLQGSLDMHQGSWHAQIKGQGLTLGKLVQLLPETLRPKDWSLSGKLSLQADVRGQQDEVQKLSLKLTGHNIAYSDPEGSQAAEKLGLLLTMNATLRQQEWTAKADLALRQGQLYSEPIYVSLDEHPLLAKSRFRWQIQSGSIRLDEANIELPGVMTAAINGTMEKQQWQTMDMQVKVKNLSAFYRILVQPFMIGSAWDELTVKGSGEGSIKLQQNELLAVDMQLQQADVEDAQGRLGISQLDTDFHWRVRGKALASTISMAAGHLFEIDFGAWQADLSTLDGGLQLKHKVIVPLLGGVLSLDNLLLEGLFNPPVKWQFALSAEAIQLDALSQALDWPPLSGQLDGRIPRVHYEHGKAVLDGKLVLDVFAGRVIVDGLQVLGLMDVAPVLETRLRLQKLDLAQITNTFSFGRIEGLLNGEVDDLQLVGWQVNRFKAGIRTPDKQKSRRRISQRAIDNLTSLGTGASAGLSGTALRMFKDFAYDKIALEVDLVGDMASLDGIPYQDGGYYIVKGAGLPRIDVIGRTREIAWKDLLSRIQDARFDDMVVE